MRRVFLLVFTTLVLACATPTRADWPSALQQTLRSIASVQHVITGEDGMQSRQTVCTAFSIDKNRQLLLTAAHCLADALTVDGQIAWVVYVNPELDVAILQAPGVRREAIAPRVAPVYVGLEIVAVGHAYSYEVPMVKAGLVSNPYMLIPELKLSFLIVTTGFVGGMSGGPIVDLEGRLVGVVQRSNYLTGLGAPVEKVLAATRGFWPEELPE